MKQFFRELKEPLISDQLIDQMIRVKQEFDFDSSSFLKQLRRLLDQLPTNNYTVLKYVVQFLLRVAANESSNKMSVLSLAIVFGPSLFRSAPGMVGLKEQGMITPILIKFIQHSGDLFNRDALSDSTTTHRLLDTAQLETAPPPEAQQKRSPPPKPKRKPHLFNTPPASQLSPSEVDSFLSPHPVPISRHLEDPPSLREIMSPWQCRLKSPVSPSPASSGNFKAELQLLIRETLDMFLWGSEGDSEEESHMKEEMVETPRSHKPDQRMSVKSLISQFEDTSVVYGTAYRLTELQAASSCLKHSASNYDLHSLTRSGDPAAEGEQLFVPSQTLDFLTLDRPRGPSNRKAPSREGRSRGGSHDFSSSELDSFFGVDTTGNTTTSTASVTQLTNLTALSQLSSILQTSDRSHSTVTMTTDIQAPPQQELREELREVKREIRRFQLEFRQNNGRKPTMQEKECIRPIVLRYGEIKLQLGELQEGSGPEGTISPSSPRQERIVSVGSTQPVPAAVNTPETDSRNTAAWKYKIEMNTIANTLQERRKESSRPSQIHAMSFEQLRQEKRDLQKALLVYEGKYGRPQGDAVIVMRPLYDRYRAIKQFLSKHPEGRLKPLHSGCESLQSLNSLHQTENTLSTIYASLGSVYPPEGIPIPLLNNYTDSPQLPQNASGMSLQSVPSAASVTSPQHRYPSPIQDTHTNSLKDFSLISTLHEYKEFLVSNSGLKPQDHWLSCHYLRGRKKDLKQKLQEFEKEFRDKYERKPNKSDRESMLLDYKEYRQLKDKLTFLETNFNVNIRGQGGKGDNEISP